MKIKGGGLQTWILAKHANSITKSDVAALMEDESFFFTSYFFHPYYQGKGLKNNAFHKAALVAIEIWQGLNHTHKETELTCQIFSINPTQANFERNFLTLNWILELNYVGRDLTESELRKSINIASINGIISLEDKNKIIANTSDNNLPLESF
ncbi:hypothetical protein C1645_821561 [Glomus cerebriforme]|uniref:Uncharacterized protein n=1 Tax=Glomus cerebriforme TaxID=658196 RepID=A0A397T0M4_9GLOM|nr:hypothetical protein C1645_821561 [Glomus cerebriforme]